MPRAFNHQSAITNAIAFRETNAKRSIRTDAMAEKKQESGFTVTDRRLFTEDGELRQDAREEAEPPKAATPPAPFPAPTSTQTAAKEPAPAASPVAPFPPSAAGIAGPEIPPP